MYCSKLIYFSYKMHTFLK